MKLHIAHQEDNKLGGGWTFIRNLSSVLETVPYDQCDTYLIPSPSICSKEEVEKAKADGKKIILRVDNIVRNSRNRNTGMSRMKKFAGLADVVIYQSDFAKALLSDYIGRPDGVVILNGVDTNIFHPRGKTESTTARFMYSRVNRDETKNWEMARFSYQQESKARDGDANLNIVGHFSPELVQYNFDFYDDEKYRYWGIITDPGTLASIYRDSDYFLYTYWNDACSNSLIEALCCGCIISDPYNMVSTGGATEIIEAFNKHGSDYFSLERMAKQYEVAMS